MRSAAICLNELLEPRESLQPPCGVVARLMGPIKNLLRGDLPRMPTEIAG